MNDVCRVNDRGNVELGWPIGGDRYPFDFRFCTAAGGWTQYDTKSDAAYFGVWVNVDQRKVITFAEGDLVVTHCPTRAHLVAELQSMAAFHGPPPPAFVSFDFGDDRPVTRTEHYVERPTGLEVAP